MAGSSLMDTLFQRTLDDLIKGLRLQLIGESAFISKAMDEIRREIKSTDPQTKSTALQKLSYLSSLHGIDMNWAAFHVVEVMSSSRFAQKKIGYLAASQSFHEATPVLLLITNQLRKDLTSTNEFEVSLALDCLSRFATTDLARDLTPEIFTLLSSSKVFVRKKAIGVVLRVFGKYPDAVRVCFKRLVENLESSDPRILSAVVGVFCELASQDPRSYLPLAPEFYRILTDSKNNWVLIKVLKIFKNLAPLEPRLARKIVEPITEHMRRTGAKSLMFECIRTVVTSLSDFESAVRLAVERTREFLVDDDPNLKYLGLHALSILVPKHSWAVLENKEVVIKSLSDVDPNVKFESLRLVMAMVSDNNVAEICRVLVNLALKSDPEFCNEILGSILATCGENVYEIIIDFDWYVSLLGEMSRIPHCRKGEEIENQLIDISMRVKDARPTLVMVGRDLLIDPALLGNPFMHRILSAAAWVSGQYVQFSGKPFELLEALLQPRSNLLPPSVRAVYVQSAFKVTIFCLNSYIQEQNIDSSSYVETLVENGSESISARECHDASDLCEQVEEFNPRGSNQPPKVTFTENDRGTLSHVQTCTSASLEDNSSSLGSIIELLNFIQFSLGPLTWSHDVELLERSRNLLNFIELIRQQIPDDLDEKDGSSEMELAEISKIVELILEAFSDDFGPMSINAQERVPIPEGLILNENLDDLEMICSDLQLPEGSYSFGNSLYEERVDSSILSQQSQQESESSKATTSLLSEHRKRHGLYYLPSDKTDDASNDYPPANELKLQDNLDDDAAHLVKLAERSLALKKKSNSAKPRPVVVRLDEGDEFPVTSKKPQLNDEQLSDAVRDVLVGSDARPTSSQTNQTSKPSSRRKGKEKQNADNLSESKENLGDVEEQSSNMVDTSLRRTHRHHGKDGKQSSLEKSSEKKDQAHKKSKRTSSQRHGKQKAKQSGDASVPVASQTVIPDFLL
ncbi:AP-3 complex subunit delta [Benincasa hispida]|uniref:AP-3 complex subunit delta n=1 Tax=Benincasa hispida TaxID=102211 RepID=UPI001900CDBD|nr:AP-3 complex subunit delta [Benincasa hispida]